MTQRRNLIDGIAKPSRVIVGGGEHSNDVARNTPRQVKPVHDVSIDDDIQRSIDILEKEENSENEKTRKETRRQEKLSRINKKRQRKGKSQLTYRQLITRRIVKWAVFFALIAGLIFAGIYIKKSFDSLSNLFQGNIFDIVKKEPLKQDENGQTNILLFGTSPEEWDGADLTDSIMVVSVNQEKMSVHTISLPRDLYVKHICKNFLGTTAGKLNESYVCGKSDSTGNQEDAENAGQKELAKAVSEVLGLDIHYRVHANWKVLTSIVDAIGGIDVTVESYDGSPIVYDVATGIRYKNGETVHMNGETALKFSRARGAFGGTGLSGSNFDRERNQQKVIAAIMKKIKETNKADFNTMSEILSALGDNIKTSFETKELRTLVDLAGSIQSDKVQSIPLIGDDISLFSTSTIGGVSAVVPTAGTYNYQQISSHVRRKLNGGEVVSQENPKIVILNASGIAGLAYKHQQKLIDQGLEVISIGNSTHRSNTHIIYDMTQQNKQTLASLKKAYGDTVKSKQDAPTDVQQYTTADFVIILNDQQ